MAERRMMSKKIIDSDAFTEMPLSSQALYFHLLLRADDDGFLNNAKKIMRNVGANQNDYDMLLMKRFIIQFDEGVCVINIGLYIIIFEVTDTNRHNILRKRICFLLKKMARIS